MAIPPQETGGWQPTFKSSDLSPAWETSETLEEYSE
jgi:hypothetical protein